MWVVADPSSESLILKTATKSCLLQNDVASSRERRLHRAQDHLLTHLDRPFRLSELATVTHCSGRNLQLLFVQAYGVGPLEWFRTVRLKKVHRELLEQSSSATRIAEVAMRWGFSHLGRFSTEYRKLFGEPPSATLKKSSLNHGTSSCEAVGRTG